MIVSEFRQNFVKVWLDALINGERGINATQLAQTTARKSASKGVTRGDW